MAKVTFVFTDEIDDDGDSSVKVGVDAQPPFDPDSEEITNAQAAAFLVLSYVLTELDDADEIG